MYQVCDNVITFNEYKLTSIKNHVYVLFYLNDTHDHWSRKEVPNFASSFSGNNKSLSVISTN
jgi:hypothetical protein